MYAIVAAALYAINVPFSKMLLGYVEPTMMAAFLYLGAGLGMFIYSIVSKAAGKATPTEPLTKKELPYGGCVQSVGAIHDSCESSVWHGKRRQQRSQNRAAPDHQRRYPRHLPTTLPCIQNRLSEHHRVFQSVRFEQDYDLQIHFSLRKIKWEWIFHSRFILDIYSEHEILHSVMLLHTADCVISVPTPDMPVVLLLDIFCDF